ncbi:MAG TPA: serine hydroxymethyltransferase, partial [Dissulfurispiraceae bacterium]|nr:serine hydroxymethyltransferase [Dissulfurispiraceae bacterium]
KAGVTVNKNAIPYDSKPPAITSGIRLGTPCVTTRGMGAPEMDEIADIISGVVRNIQDASIAALMNKRVQALCAKFPIYAS